MGKTGKQDDIQINIFHEHEVTYWAKELNISPEQLKKAVDQVGPRVDDVKKVLTGSRH
ncbi:DUF3606 domain-containing protein [Niastella populi]|uniref:DUF3606 domain-containing protein n=1 Tax=Niastella populi TaxID=550983 RepID=UPI0009BF4549